jgi:Fe-S cluster assembly iron-binding protein IscA
MDISAQAQQEVERFTKEELRDGEFVRIARGYQCGASRFQLTIDDVRTPMDDAIPVGDAEVIVERSCLGLLAQCRLDFDGDAFVFLDELGISC